MSFYSQVPVSRQMLYNGDITKRQNQNYQHQSFWKFWKIETLQHKLNT